MRLLIVVGLAVVLAAAGPAVAGAAKPMPGQTYTGVGPKGGSEVILVVSSTGARVQRLTLGYERGCRLNGKRLPQLGSVYVRNARIRGGRFSWRRSKHFAATGASFSQAVSGHFVDGGARFVGTVRERLVNPVTHVRCVSGRVAFGGAVPERVLINRKWAGSTAQGKPLTMTITAKGIEAIAFDVTLICTNGEQITRSIPALEEPAYVSDSDRVAFEARPASA